MSPWRDDSPAADEVRFQARIATARALIREPLILAAWFAAAFAVCALVLPHAGRGASLQRLEQREAKQHRTLRRYEGTLRFFSHQPRLARTRAGRIATARARVWVRVIRRELDDTRRERRQHLAARRTLQSAYVAPTSVEGVICAVFGPYCSQAVAVARCESTLNVYARNGQYEGLFQMGDYARSTYGHGWDAWTQTRAAYAYFRDAGWSPWECA